MRYRLRPVRLARFVIAMLLVSAVAPAIALAHRRPTKSERTAILAAVVKQHELNRAQATCQVVTISTVNQSYAKLAWPDRLSTACQRVAANGVIIEHRASGRWRLVTVGSTLGCPIRGVPTPVARDLGFCS